MKKLTCVILAIAIFLCGNTIIVSAGTQSYTDKISDELLAAVGVSREELSDGEIGEFDDLFMCVIWIDDIDMEPAIRYGFEKAEMTRDKPIPADKYPYEVYCNDGDKDVIVDIPSGESDLYVQTYIEAKREYASNQYLDNNNGFVETIIEKEGVEAVYVSRLSPCILAKLTFAEALTLAEYESVQRIGYLDEGEAADCALFDSLELSRLQTNLELARIDEAQSVYGIDGSGVKIGQFESGCPNIVSVVKNPSANSTTDHATNVNTIMREAAPGSTYYATGAGPSYANYINNIEWLVTTCHVNIVNMSWGLLTYNSYTEFARWIDHIAYNHDVHVVLAAGNEDVSGIRSPGMSLNAVTVGNNETYSTYDLHPSSGYSNLNPSNYVNITFKPDLCAPGVYNYSYGTSYSAPVISGTIALMCDYEPALKTKQHVVKAILAATTNKNNHRNVTMDSDFSKYGAGIVDARSAVYAISADHYKGTGTVSNSITSVTYYMPVSSSDTLMRVSLAYANRIKFSGDDHTGTVPSGDIGDLWLEIYSPSGAFITSCTKQGANLKVLQFDPRPYGTGNFKIKVVQHTSASGGRATNFGVSWR